MLRRQHPRRVIEIGSGFSSSVMLDVNDLFLDNSVQFTFIEPYPERLFEQFRDDDQQRHTVIEKPLQDVLLSLFRELSAGDILFIDSSHVVKIGSDVAYILFHILPALQSGVLIHFHDILWPFEYPEDWIFEGRAWNEAYVLRSFLQFNHMFGYSLLQFVCVATSRRSPATEDAAVQQKSGRQYLDQENGCASLERSEPPWRGAVDKASDALQVEDPINGFRWNLKVNFFTWLNLMSASIFYNYKYNSHKEA
ncbi:hypothetical protein C2W62_33810 [Candidatus Entotheonella serta]|nr:hypothetical protein C2W62_33810 [Candidatus Entotheonella serta]